MKTKPFMENYLNLEYTFERRRYGATCTMKFFTWLNYRVKGSQEWHTYGDPWPKARLNRRELRDALHDIVTRTMKPGTRVRTTNGEGLILDAPAESGCLAFQLDAYPKVLSLHPDAIIEVVGMSSTGPEFYCGEEGVAEN